MLVIDLHLTKEIIDKSAYDIPILIQIDFFEKEMDNALVNNEDEVVVIHGIGDGILKKEIHKILKNHPHVLYFINEYNPLYGFGSTKIIFR